MTFEMILIVWIIGAPDPLTFLSQASYADEAACEAQLQPRADQSLEAFARNGVPVAKVSTVCREVVPQGVLM